MRNEKWHIVEDFPNYEVSNKGRIRAISRKIQIVGVRDKKGKFSKKKIKTLGTFEIRTYQKKQRLLTPTRCKNINKTTVTLRKDGKTHVKNVSRLVLIAFVGRPKIGQEACHNDGESINNHIENLRWDTHRHNLLDTEKHGKNFIPRIYMG